MADPVVDKVVVVIDLSRYSDICKELEQQLDVTAVAAVNDQVKDLIGLALAAANILPERPPYKGTGDGAIIALDTPDEGSLFAEKLHQAAESRNRGRDVPLCSGISESGSGPGRSYFGPSRTARGIQPRSTSPGRRSQTPSDWREHARPERCLSAFRRGRTSPPRSEACTGRKRL